MDIRKEITEDNELLLWMNGKLIYKRWLDLGYSKVFDKTAYGKETFVSIIEDDKGKIRHRKKIFINGNICESKGDFWKNYTSQIPTESARYFGENLDAFNDAITAGGPGYPGDCIIEIIGVDKLISIFGNSYYDIIVPLLKEAEFVDLIIEKQEL